MKGSRRMNELMEKWKWSLRETRIFLQVIVTAVTLYILFFAIQHITVIFQFLMVLFSTFFSMLSPLFVGIVIAYLLDPFVSFYQRKLFASQEEHRGWATAFTYLSLIIGILLSSWFISYSIRKAGQQKTMETMMEDFINNFSLMMFDTESLLKHIGILSQGDFLLEKIMVMFQSVIQKIGTDMMGIIMKIGSYLLTIVMAFVIAFYLLMDKYSILAQGKEYLTLVLSKESIKSMTKKWQGIDLILSRYIRGQLLIALMMSIFISMALTIIKIEFAIVIGILSGIVNLIPLIGSIIATVLAVLVALMGDTPIKALYVLIVLTILQQIEANVIAPKVVGEKLKLHPIIVIMSIFILGSLFGLLGMLVAIPLVAFIKYEIQWSFMKKTQFFHEKERKGEEYE